MRLNYGAINARVAGQRKKKPSFILYAVRSRTEAVHRQPYGTVEGTLLAQIAARYEPELVSTDAVVPFPGVIVTPRNGLPVIVHSGKKGN